MHQRLPWFPVVSPNSYIAPAASQQGLHGLLCQHCIVHSLALPFCPFHWAGAPSSNSRKEEEVGMGTGACRALASPDPTIQWEATKYTETRCQLSSQECWTVSLIPLGLMVRVGSRRPHRETGKSLCFGIRSGLGISALSHTWYDVSLGNYLNLWAWRTSLKNRITVPRRHHNAIGKIGWGDPDEYLLDHRGFVTVISDGLSTQIQNWKWLLLLLSPTLLFSFPGAKHCPYLCLTAVFSVFWLCIKCDKSLLRQQGVTTSDFGWSKSPSDTSLDLGLCKLKAFLGKMM